ncbi:hypothetical protein ACFL5U_02350 [Candidatus Margulisiibacteriota bacterium]
MATKIPKEIEILIDEITKDADEVDKASEGLIPYYLDVIDGVIENKIKGMVSIKQFKYFESCRFKFKALWYIHQKIEELDEEYSNFVDFCIKNNNFKYFKKLSTYSYEQYHFFPFFEAIEFENILEKGKACLDSFSKAIGVIFGESPNNIDQLINVLKNNKKKDHRANKILNSINKETQHLRGSILNPKQTGKKSLRDLISHRERADVYFLISKNENGKMTYSAGALLQIMHPELTLFTNNILIKDIATNIWFYTFQLLQNSFKAI